MISLFFWRCVWWMIDYVKLFRLIVIKFLVSSRASGLLDFAMPCGICCFHFVERVRFILLTSFSWDWKCKWRWDASDKEVCGSKYILEVTSLVHFWLFLAFHVIKMNFNIYYCFSRNVCLIIVFWVKTWGYFCSSALKPCHDGRCVMDRRCEFCVFHLEIIQCSFFIQFIFYESSWRSTWTRITWKTHLLTWACMRSTARRLSGMHPRRSLLVTASWNSGTMERRKISSDVSKGEHFRML